MKSTQKPFYLLMVLALLAGLLGFQPAKPVQAANALRISQVYGGGGLDGATYTHDFIEIFNSGSSSVSLAGMSIQYASGTGAGNLGATTSQLTELPDLMLGAGQYYLIQGASGSIGAPLPLMPDLTDSTPIDSSGYAGKVALVNSQDSLGCNGGTTPCDAGQLALIVDLIGYGITYFYEGSGSAPLLSSSTSALRVDGGCTDTDDNSDDFEIGSPVPRNTSSSTNICNLGDQPPTVASTVPANGAETVAVNADITITFSEPVTVADGWYRISCGTSNTYTAAVDPANPVFTLNPAPDFTAGETCTVTIFANKVNDDDNLDEDTANYMLADHSFSFSITEGCVGDYTPIYDIQGSGLESPLVGKTVTTEGVVVGDFQDGGKNGFFIQDETGDEDDATSDGIFVYYTSAPDVLEGDKIRLTGLVSEYNGLTEISGSSLQLCSTGNSITPTPVSLPVTAVDDFEKFEGMLVTFTQPLVISEYFNFDRYGEIVLTSERHMTPTAVEEPGTPEQAAAALAYQLDRITLDDGSSYQNPDPAYHPNGDIFDMTNLFRGGGTVAGVTGVMDYGYSLYRVQLTEGGTYVDANPRTAAPSINKADLKIASFNVLNYFVTLDDDSPICGPSGTLDCRGANDEEEFTRQRNKILAAMAIINADIFGLMEIENDRLTGEGNAVADLVSGLNDALGTGTYTYIDTGSIGGDAIKQAILYKPDSVTPVGDYQILDSSVDSRFIDTKNRPVLAQVFEDNETGEQFVVAVNHLKSKGSPCDEIGDPDQGDGQGNCNHTRLAAAQALMDWLAVPSNFPDAEKKLIIGDLNSYDKEDPIDAIKLGADDLPDTADDYLDMIYEIQGENAYSYVFDGQTGYLDHALANQIMAESIVDVNIWHINADEPDLIDYDTSFKLPAQDALYAPDAYRSSDHDPVIVHLLRNYAPEANAQSVTTTEDTPIDITLTGTDLENDTLSFEIVDQPAYGTVNLVGALATYTPTADYTGPDSFTFKAFDGSLYSDSATVNITITPVNDAPVALDDAYTTNQAEILTVVTANGVLENDTDIDTEVLFAVLADNVINGTLTLESDGSFVYTPNVDFHGTDSFTYKASDGYLESDATTVTITVNNAPVASDQTVETSEDNAKDIALVAIDANSDELTYVIVAQPANGSVTLDGAVATYTPALNYYGPDSFKFKVNDGTVDSNNATVTITVTSVNDIPVADGQDLSTDEDTPLVITLMGSDVDGNPLTFSVVTTPTYGYLYVTSPLVTYTPPQDFSGTDSFTFRAYDGTAYSAPATISITINAINDAPIANPDEYTTNEDTQLVVEAPGLLANVGDPDSSPESLSITLGVDVLHGELVLKPDGSFTYMPDADFNGQDSFTYMGFDDFLYSEEAAVTITINPVNDAPVAVADAYSTDEDVLLEVTAAEGVLAKDTDDGPMTAVLVKDVSNGTLALVEDGSFTYLPDADFNGEDSFTYKAFDSEFYSEVVTVTITIMPVNDAPVANDQSLVTDEGTPVAIVLTAEDVDGDTISWFFYEPTHGILTGTPPNLTYTPAADFYGEDSFTFIVDDGTDNSNLATVTITVNPLNDPPEAVDDAYETNQDVELVVNAPGVLDNDTDAEDNDLTAELVDDVANGTLDLAADGSFTYMPDAGFVGEDSFTYKAFDGVDYSNVVTVTITVNEVAPEDFTLYLPLIMK